MKTATQPVLDVSLTPNGSASLQRAESSDPMLAMIERFVTDPSVDVDKLERLVQMHERAKAKTAEDAFNRAMSEAQAKMRPIAADADNPQTRSKYASYAQLDRALRPIYTELGFGLSFDTGDTSLTEHVRVLCYVTHFGGHSRTYHVDMPADGKGAKGGDVMTKTHAAGSALSYGVRYLLKLIWNVAVGEDDDDGNSAGRQQEKAPIGAPPGFADWVADMDALIEAGADWKRYSEAWNGSKEAFRLHLAKTNKHRIEHWKKTAGARTKGAPS